MADSVPHRGRFRPVFLPNNVRAAQMLFLLDACFIGISATNRAGRCGFGLLGIDLFCEST